MGELYARIKERHLGCLNFEKEKSVRKAGISQEGNDYLFLITVELQIATQKGVRYFLSKTITFFCG